MSCVAPTVDPASCAGSEPSGTAPASSSLSGRSGAETASLNFPASEFTRWPTSSRYVAGSFSAGCVSKTKRALPFVLDASQPISLSWSSTSS